MKVALVGSGPLAGSKLVADLIYKSLRRFMPSAVLLLPGHISFNALARAQAARLRLAVEEMQPPRPTWIGQCLQSVRKRMVRGCYAKAVARDVDLVIAFKREGLPGATFDQLVNEAEEAVVFTIRPSGEELLSTIPIRHLARIARSPGR